MIAQDTKKHPGSIIEFTQTEVFLMIILIF